MAPRSDESGAEPRAHGGESSEGGASGAAAGAPGASPTGSPLPSPPPGHPHLHQLPEPAAAFALAAAVVALLDEPPQGQRDARLDADADDDEDADADPDASDDEVEPIAEGQRGLFRTYREALTPPPPPGPVVLAPFVQVNPPPLAQPDAPDFLPVDHNLPQLLRQVTGSDDLAAVESVRVRVVARETSLQRLCLYMPRLRELHLDGSRLGSLRDLGCGLSNLEILSVGNCGLDSLDGTFGLMTLKELYAVDNSIDDVSLCTSLPHIRVIDLTRNAVHDISYIGFLSICSSLRSLALLGCPVSRLQGYRGALIDMLPQLQMLDGLSVQERGEVSDEEGFFEDGGDEVDEESEDVYPRANNSDGEAHSVNGSASGEEMNYSMYNNANMSAEDSLQHLSIFSRSMSEDANSITQDDSSSSSGYVASRKSTFSGRRYSTPAGKTVKNPSTRTSSAFGSSCRYSFSEGTGISRNRPSTASTSASSSNSMDDSSEPSQPLLRNDAPSLLTSGSVLCGSLAAALRARRKKKNSVWAEEVQEEPAETKDEPGTSTSDTDNSPNYIFSEEMSKDSNKDELKEDSQLLLENSRKWRRIFQTFRDDNRRKWENESENESYDKTDECHADASEVNTEEFSHKEEGSVVNELENGIKKLPLKEETHKIPPCCAMMQMWRKNERKNEEENCSTSESSTKSNRSGSRGHEFMRF